MPIRPENRERYPKLWKILSFCIRADRAKWRCEFPECGAVNGEPHPTTGSKVVLTVAHLNHKPEDCRMCNLLAGCQKCHNAYDAKQRRSDRRSRLDKQSGQVNFLG